MAVALAPSSIVQVRIWTTDSEQAAVNTIYYRCTDAGNLPYPTDEDMAAELDDIIKPALRNIIYSGATYNGLQLTVLGGTPQTATLNWPITGGGGLSGDVGMARQAAGLNTWTTIYSGSKYRGRTFWPFPAVSDDEGLGVPTALYQTHLAALLAGLFNYHVITGDSGGFLGTQIGVYSRKAPAPTFTPINNFIIRKKWATQKKRGSFGKANSSPV